MSFFFSCLKTITVYLVVTTAILPIVISTLGQSSVRSIMRILLCKESSFKAAVIEPRCNVSRGKQELVKPSDL